MQRTVLVTGGNRGIGQATAAVLAREGWRVLLTARDVANGEQAVRELRAKVPGATVEARALDLSSLESVRACAARLVDEGITLDALLNNAGVMQQSPRRRVTADGFEETLGVNVLGPLLLTRLLLPALARSPEGRIVWLGSRLHLPGSRGTPVGFDFADPQLERSYEPTRAYKNSKLALMWVSHEFDRRLDGSGTTSNVVCPGFVPETAALSVQGGSRWFLQHVLVHAPFATRLEDAAKNVAFVVTDPSLELVSGAFFGERHVLDPSADARDVAKAARFWTWACARVGVPESLVAPMEAPFVVPAGAIEARA